MGLPQEWLDLMPLTVQVRHRTGVNQYNESTWSAAVPYRARMEPVHRIMRTAIGEERVISARLIVDAQGELVDTDQVILPDGTSPDIATVTTQYDENGVHHQEIMLEG